MLAKHYLSSNDYSIESFDTLLNRHYSNKKYLVFAIKQFIETCLHQKFIVSPSEYSQFLHTNECKYYFNVLSKIICAKRTGYFISDLESDFLRSEPLIYHHNLFSDVTVNDLSHSLQSEYYKFVNRNGASVREPIYLGQWGTINLFDSRRSNPYFPAAKYFNDTLKLLTNSSTFTTSIQSTKKNPKYNKMIIQLSVLGPDSKIAPHFGVNEWISRLHFPIYIPDKSSILIYDCEHSWDEQKFVVIDDTFIHCVYNHSKKNRVILLIDIVNPHLNLV